MLCIGRVIGFRRVSTSFTPPEFKEKKKKKLDVQSLRVV